MEQDPDKIEAQPGQLADESLRPTAEIPAKVAAAAMGKIAAGEQTSAPAANPERPGAEDRSDTPQLPAATPEPSADKEAAATPEHSKRATIEAPPHERTPHKGSMLDQWGILGRILSRLFFSSVFFPTAGVETVSKAAAQGTVVYVLRMRNTLEFLYFNYAFQAHKLPLARFANGVRLMLWLPLGLLLRRLFRKKRTDREPTEVLRRLTRARRSSALFLRTPPGLIPPGDFEGPYLQTLVDLQQQQERPIMLVPLTIIWGRTPVRAPQGPLRLFDPLLGDMDEPRLFRRIWQVIRYARRSLALVCDPLDLKEFLAQHPEEKMRLAALDQELMDRIESERRVRIGPRRAHPLELRRRVLESHPVKAAIILRAQQSGQSVWKVRRGAARILKKMQASMTARGVRRLSWMIRQVWKRIFAGFEVDEAGIARVQTAGKAGPLLFLPSHRSHVDYLVLSDLCIARDVLLPHIAAGINLSFWPMGWLFRTGGAFFLRRRFQGDELYSTLLREYVTAMLQEGHNIEIFIEGTRSRTGQVLPPKLGLLSIVADLAAQGKIPPVHVVPASIGYERVLELASLTRETVGGTKRPESVGGLLRAARVLRSHYGYVNVQLGEPFEIREFLSDRGYTGQDDSPEVRRRAIRALGYHNNAAASAITAVTPTSLCAAAFLAPGTLGVKQSTLLRTLKLLGEAARVGGARFVDNMWRGEEPLGPEELDQAIAFLTADKAIQTVGHGDELVYAAENQARIRLEYYKNQMVQHVLDHALMAMALRALNIHEGKAIPLPALRKACFFLARLVRLHFVHSAGRSLDQLFEGALQRLLDLELITQDDQQRVHLDPSGLEVIDLLAGLLESNIEAHGAAAKALLMLKGGPMLRRSLERESLEQLHRRYLVREMRRYESCQIFFVKVAIDWLTEEGILMQQGEGKNVEVSLARAHSDGRALEVLVERTERLLPRRAA